MKKLNTRLAALVTAAALLLAVVAPSAVFADGHEAGNDHGPVPIAIVGSVAGAAVWLVSVPFTVLIAPAHVLDTLEPLVLDPIDVAMGAD